MHRFHTYQQLWVKSNVASVRITQMLIQHLIHTFRGKEKKHLVERDRTAFDSKRIIYIQKDEVQPMQTRKMVKSTQLLCTKVTCSSLDKERVSFL